MRQHMRLAISACFERQAYRTSGETLGRMCSGVITQALGSIDPLEYARIELNPQTAKPKAYIRLIVFEPQTRGDSFGDTSSASVGGYLLLCLLA